MKTKSLTKVTLLTIFIMSVVTAVTLNSCQKEVIKPKVSPTSAAGKNTLASSSLMNELSDMIFSVSGTKNQKGLGQAFNFDDTSACVSTIIDTISKPHTITRDYGSGCTGSDGLTRSGVAIISFNDRDIRIVNNVYSLTLQNYTCSNSPVVNGSISYTNTGYNSNGNLVLAETGTLSSSNGSAYDTLSANYQYEWISGAYNSQLSGYQFSVTGGCNLTSSSSDTGSITITSPLIKNCKSEHCNFNIQGTAVSTWNNHIKYMDYGRPGACSGQMTVTENGVTSIQNQ